MKGYEREKIIPIGTMNMERRLLGKRINQIRKERGLTSEALSEICDVNAGHIRQIESGIRLPSLPLFIRICQALKTAPNEILKDQFDPEIIESENKLLLKVESLTPKQKRILSDLLDTFKKSMNGDSVE
ncbi:helix-turn-helix domain-containing protein [Anaerostipes caccae]|nr:helix-turn-helix transcriptional regulator [Anaerostipes caccae]